MGQTVEHGVDRLGTRDGGLHELGAGYLAGAEGVDQSDGVHRAERVIAVGVHMLHSADASRHVFNNSDPDMAKKPRASGIAG